jgi:tetratricopeptide (TPR) repeat protein
MYEAPLAGALLSAFAAGALVMTLAASVWAGARGWRRWRGERRTRREAARAAVTARAQHLVWAGDYGQARNELLRAERGAPPDVGRTVLLAETHLHEGDPAGARKIVEESLVHVGLEPRLLDLLADAAERMRDLRGAADALERARRVLPQSPRLARRLRDVYAAAGRFPEALALQAEILLGVHDAATLAAEEQVMRGLRYEAALVEPDARQAARLLAALGREEPSFVPAWVSAGDRFAQAGRRLAARRVWERGARHVPAAVLLERLERLAASEGKPERMTRFYRRLVRRHPQAPAVRFLGARHLLAQGALGAAEEALSSFPPEIAGHPLSHALWAELHRRRGNHSVAADSFARAFGTELGLAAPFRCAVCRRETPGWAGRCQECGRWGTARAAADRAPES